MQLTDSYFSLIIPVYNEQDRLERPLPRVFEYCSRFSRCEIIFSDDGSTDGTYEKLVKIRDHHPFVRVIKSEKNFGKGHAVKIGLAEAKGEILLFSDADFSTPINDADTLFEALNAGCDLAFGSRGLLESNIVTHQPWYREAAGKGGNLLARALLPIDFHDTQCGFKMMSRKAADVVVPRLTINGFAFDIELLIIAKHHGLKVAEVPVTWGNVEGTKVQPHHNLQVLGDLLRIRYRLALGVYS
jgi:dolichyl-phosphate beta-glucosyltransferase